MEGLKGPYLMLCNHNSFFDFKVATMSVFPRRSTYIIAVDGFINREWLVRTVGGIPTKKFVNDIALVRHIKTSLETHKVICQLYPEARYSLTGTNAILPDSLGKLIKLLKHPVVTLISHGHHLRQPVWNLSYRKVKTKTDMTQILTKEEVMSLSVDEINQRIKEYFVYDDYQYQKDNKIKIDYKNRAKNIHKILYKCPHCKKDHVMRSNMNKLWCEACNASYVMDVYGRLSSINVDTMFTHVPDWFEWIRKEVKREIKSNNYHIEIDVDVDSLPNASGFYRLGEGVLKHNKDGFSLLFTSGEKEYQVLKPVKANYSVHLEYDYFGKGDCVSFSTGNNTYYLFPKDKGFSVTKFHFGVEELFKLKNN